MSHGISFRRGFTLVELMVVISIIAMLSSMVLASVQEVRDKARIAAGQLFATNLFHARGSEMIARYTFDTDTDTPNNTAVDESGNSKDMSCSSTLSTDTVSGKGKSRSFMSSTNCNARFDPVIFGDSIIASFWIKLPSSGAYNFFGYIGNAFRIGSSSQFNSPVSAYNYLKNGKWHQFAYSYDSDSATLYLDGKLVDRTTFSYQLPSYIDRIFISGSNVFIDDLNIYSGEGAQIAVAQNFYFTCEQDCKANDPNLPSMLTFHYDFDEPTMCTSFGTSNESDEKGGSGYEDVYVGEGSIPGMEFYDVKNGDWVYATCGGVTVKYSFSN